jgi:hypothetical protein
MPRCRNQKVAAHVSKVRVTRMLWATRCHDETLWHGGRINGKAENRQITGRFASPMQPPSGGRRATAGATGGRAEIEVAERPDGIPAAAGTALIGRALTSFGPTGIRCAACSPGCTATSGAPDRPCAPRSLGAGPRTGSANRRVRHRGRWPARCAPARRCPGSAPGPVHFACAGERAPYTRADRAVPGDVAVVDGVVGTADGRGGSAHDATGRIALASLMPFGWGCRKMTGGHRSRPTGRLRPVCAREEIIAGFRKFAAARKFC